MASAGTSAREIITAAMKKTNRPARIPARHPGQNGNGNGSVSHLVQSQRSKRELEQAIQRYVDLYDFAPVGYVSLNRTGRVEEVNLEAARMLDRARHLLIGRPFALYVVHEDAGLFLTHLLKCRSLEGRVETELRLMKRNHEIIFVCLSSTPTTSSMHDGALRYQTAIIDLTERKRSEKAIRESERPYRTLFDLVPVAVYACDAKGVIKEFNHRAAELWGRDPNANGAEEKFCGSSKIFHPDGRPMPHDKCPMARALRGEQLKPSELEIIVEREDGDRRHVIPSPSILRNDRGEIIGAINCLYDITDRKRTESALAEAARHQQALYEFVQRRQEAESLRDVTIAALDATKAAVRCDRVSVLLMDDNGAMRFVASRGLSKSYRKAVEGHSPWKSSARNPQPICMSDIRGGDIPNRLKNIIRAEGIQAAAFIPLIREGKLIGKLMTYYNTRHVFSDEELSFSLTISSQLALGIQQKRAADALRESEELHRALVRQTAVGMARTNLKRRFVFVNTTFCEMLGYPESELLDKTIVEITHPDDIAESKRLFHGLALRGEPYRLEKRYARKDGSVFWVTVSASPMRDKAGKMCGAVAVILDINARKKAELALEESKALLESRVRERTSALLAINQDLQNEVALRKRLEGEVLEISDREQRRLGQDLHDGLCQHLTAIGFMAREIASRLRAGRHVGADELEKICDFVNEGVTEARTVARGLHPVEMDSVGFTTAIRSMLHRQSALPYRLDMDEEISIPNSDDATNLYRIVREAVINANKHARANEVVVKMRATPKQIELSVTDDGIGIGDNSHTSSGLGFHIMEYRARSIGARLEIVPAKPSGTRVACYMPRK